MINTGGSLLDGKTVTELRIKNGLTQSDFWKKYGISQSTASRYESTNVPLSVAILIYLEYMGGIDIALIKEKITGES